MRLLDTQTYELQNFLNNPPPYAILSHVWGDEEVTYEAMANKSARSKLKGWTKILRCCRRALKDGWKYVWIDTCCIQKSDPTELSEAINSMFRWYRDAEICYAHLDDVPPKYVLRQNYFDGLRSDDVDQDYSQGRNPIPWRWHFRSSKWHTRGWTLQELLAPRFLLFLDTDWGNIGSRETYASEIEEASGIESKYLRNFRSCSVATKLSWAADRQTTREEDRAYSLLGLLDINLPLIYGEGEKAFVRLQKELIQNHNDESVLAWNRPRAQETSDTADIDFSPRGGLAGSPRDFRESGGLIQWPFDQQRRTFSITNVGVSLNAEVFARKSVNSREPTYTIKLNCRREWPSVESTYGPMALWLKSDDPDLVVFNRLEATNWRDISTWGGWTSIGRKDIFISHGPPQQTEMTAEDLCIRFEKTPSIRLSAVKWADKGDYFGMPAMELMPGYYYLAQSKGIMYVELTSDYLGRDDKTYWIVIKSGPGLPLLGIWDLGKDMDTGAVVSHLEKITECATMFPASVEISPGRLIEVAMRPISRKFPMAPKTYLIDVKCVDEEQYDGKIGRFVQFKRSVPFAFPQPST